MSALDAERISGADPQGMAGVVCEQPDQLLDALWRVEAAGLRAADAPGGLAVCGMGGSAIGGDLAAAVLGERARRPVVTLRGYELPGWIGPDWLVLCSSYSGDTEETVSAYEAAARAGAPRIVLTTGGRLAEAARADGVPVIGVPGGLQPRAAVAYMVVGTLACAAACGAAPSLRGEVEAAGALLRGLVEEWGPAADGDALPKRLAEGLGDALPVIYGSGPTEPVAVRWKTQLNENAKRHAFHASLPEADHNEVCAWRPGERVAAAFLEDAGQHPRNRRRIELTAALLERMGARALRVESRGETPLERVMSLVLLGDLVSVYAAVLAGVDPTPVETIERLKRELG